MNTLRMPLATCEKCLAILKHQNEIALYGNKNAVSDIGVGVLLAMAGLHGAILNVRINLLEITDQEVRDEIIRKIDRFFDEGIGLKKKILKTINERINSREAK
jgi:formiminotetrahydrofolate cyclodeaminase